MVVDLQFPTKTAVIKSLFTYKEFEEFVAQTNTRDWTFTLAPPLEPATRFPFFRIEDPFWSGDPSYDTFRLTSADQISHPIVCSE